MHWSNVFGEVDKIYCCVKVAYTFENSTERKNLWLRRSISRKVILALPKYFHNFVFKAVAWKRIVDLSYKKCKGYTAVVLGNSEVTLLRKRDDASLYPSANCVLVIFGFRLSELYFVELPGLPYYREDFIKPWCLLIFDFSYTILKWRIWIYRTLHQIPKIHKIFILNARKKALKIHSLVK